MTRIIRSTPAETPPAKSPALEFRRDVLVDDALGGDVGQRAFEAVADLDAQVAIVLGNRRAARRRRSSCGRSSRLPQPGARIARSPRRPSSARSAPRSGCPFASRNPSAFASATRCRRCDSVPVWSTTRPLSGGTATSASAGNSPAQQQRKQDGSCSVHRGQSFGPLRSYFDGAAGVGLKSTFGAVEISFSFSTEKFGFSL